MLQFHMYQLDANNESIRWRLMIRPKIQAARRLNCQHGEFVFARVSRRKVRCRRWKGVKCGAESQYVALVGCLTVGAHHLFCAEPFFHQLLISTLN